MGELDVTALVASTYGVPVVLVTGDDVVCADARQCLGEGVVTVPVKKSLDRFAAECIHPEVARERIREGARSGVAGREAAGLLPLEPQYEVVLELLAPTQAWICGCMPGVERVGERTVRYLALRPQEIFPFLMAAMAAARGVTDSVY